jgi:hypothetical protein
VWQLLHVVVCGKSKEEGSILGTCGDTETRIDHPRKKHCAKR